MSTPTGSTSFCQGANSGGYSCTPTGSSCLTTDAANTCTVTWQWLLDGSAVSGATGSFVVSTTGALTPVTLSAATANTFAAGPHTLACRFTSNVTNCSAVNPITSSALNITVNAAPAGVTVAGGGTVCGSTTLTASGGSPGTIYYQGTTSNGTSTTTVSSSQVISSAGTYYFRSRSSAGCWGAQGSAGVTINPLPNLSNFATNATSPCLGAGSTVTVSSSSVGNGTYTVTYSLSGANTVASATSSLTMSGGFGTFSIPSGSLSNSGATTITISSVRNASLCSATPGSGNSAGFTVNALPTTAAVTGGGIYCEATVLSASGGTGGTMYFQGTTSNGTSTGTPSDLELILSSGTYYFRAQSPAGCWGPQGSAAVTINPVPTAVTVSGDGTFCGNATLTATGGTGGTIYFQGTTNNGTSVSTASSSQSVAASGTYYFRARTAAGCWGNQGSATVSINSSPDVSNFSTAATSLCQGSSSTVTVTSSTLADGTYTVTYTLAGANTAAATTASVTMSGGAGTFSIPAGSLTANGSTTVTITDVQNASSCSSTPSSGNAAGFSVSALPTITSITSSISELCVGTGVTFTANGVSGPGAPSTFSWTGPSGFSASSATDNTSFTPSNTAASGNYSVTVTYPGTGCVSSQVVTAAAITVNAMPSVGSISPSESQLCVGSGFELTANSVSGTGTPSFAWSGPGGYSQTTSTGTSSVSATSVANSGSYSLTVTYPGVGCATSEVVSMAVAVNELPTVADVTASSAILCVGNDLTLNAGAVTGTGTPTYMWTGPNAYNANTSAGNTTLNVGSTAATGSYSLVVVYPGAGCSSAGVATSAVTVNDLPTISGISASSSTLCPGAGLTLTAGSVTGVGTPSYQWSGPNGFNTTTATNNTALTVNAASGGMYSVNVSYTGTGCTSTTVASSAVTVNALPTIGSVSASTTDLCVGADVTLTANSVTGTGSPIFNWSGPDSYADATLGDNVTFNAASTAASGSYSVIVTFPGTGCVSTEVVTTAINVNTLPSVASITPSLTELCEGSTLTLISGATTGTGVLTSYNWSGPDSYNNTTTVDNTSLTVPTIAASGNYSLTVTYPGTGCTSAAVAAAVTVNPLPVNTTGTPDICVNSTTDLDNTDAGGTWTSTDNDIATVDADGMVEGIAAGNIDIIYTLSTGCSRAYAMTVNALPAGITGDMDVCDNEQTTLSSTSTGGVWVCEDDFITIAGGILVTGTGAGTAAVTYTLPTGCRTTAVLTVFPLPDPITGMGPVCEQETITLASTTTGGSWSTSDNAVADIASSTGVVSGISEGNATITYTSMLGCITVAEATVNNTPVAITGNAEVCDGLITDLENLTPGGTWSSSVIAVGTVDAATGEVHGLSEGTTEVTYMLGTGCKTMQVVTVHPLPDVITGSDEVCEGLATTLANTVTGGTWHSSDITIASVGSLTGTVTGETAGNVNITYTLPTSCSITMPVTVNPLPADITGTFFACEGASSIMNDPGTSGTWASSDDALATIDAGGNVNAIAAGDINITYTLPTGCLTTHAFTVHPLPTTFMGAVQICEGVSGTLGNAHTGGTWMSNDVAVADVSTAGSIAGMTAGTAEVVYTLATGCSRSEVVTVNAAVPAISGAGPVCEELSLTLGNTEGGGTWTSQDAAIATAGATDGIVTGISSGMVDVTYTLPTGCFTTATVTVNALPAAITGTMNVCEGLSTTLANTSPDGTWSGGAPGISSIDASGSVTGIAAGTAAVTYQLTATGCERHVIVTVNALPDVQTVTGGGSYCAGGTGVNIGVGSSTAGITYTLKQGSLSLLAAIGTGTPIDFGMFTTAGTYTVHAANSATGCVNSMDGSAEVIITPIVYPSITITSAPGDTMCAGTSATFTANPINGGTAPVYEWMVNAAVVSVASSYTYTPLNGDVVAVKLTSSEACPNTPSVSTTRPLVVINNETPTVSIVKTSSDTTCQFANATFSATQTWGGSTPVFSWRRNGSAIGTGPSLSYLPADGDLITCKLTSNFRCRLVNEVTSNSITMNVDSVYVPSVDISVSPGLVVAPNNTVTLTATVANAGPTPVFVWSVNGLEQPAENTPVLKRHFNNGDEIKCTVYGSGACGLTSFNTVIMTVDPTVGLPGSTSPIQEIKLVPNPNNGRFTLTSKVLGAINEPIDIIVINTLGQTVYSGTAEVQNGQIEKAIQLDGTLANGMYMLHMKSASGHTAVPFVLNQ